MEFLFHLLNSKQISNSIEFDIVNIIQVMADGGIHLTHESYSIAFFKTCLVENGKEDG